MALVLAACSGGGYSGGSGGGGTSTAPTPTPSPTPTPTPVTLVRAYGASRVAASFYFYTDASRIFGSDTGFGYGTRDGTYRVSSAGALQTSPLPRLGTLTDRPIDSLGIDRASSTFFHYLAPPNSRAISSLTTLINAVGSQAPVRRAFMLDAGGAFGLAASTDLLQFDAIDAIESADTAAQNEGAHVLAANLRVMAVAGALARIPFPTAQVGNDPPRDYGRLAAFIVANPTISLFDNASTSALVRSLITPGQFRDDVISATAHLIKTYATTIGTQMTSNQQAARFILGIEGYLRPRLQKLLLANSAAAATEALAVTGTDIMAGTERYLETVPFNATGLVFATPDFLQLASGASVTLPAESNDLLGNYAPKSNDFSATITGFFGRDQQMVSVSVPALNAGQVTAVLHGDGTITVTAGAGFTGVTYFDYRLRNTALGEEAVGRVYLRVS